MIERPLESPSSAVQKKDAGSMADCSPLLPARNFTRKNNQRQSNFGGIRSLIQNFCYQIISPNSGREVLRSQRYGFRCSGFFQSQQLALASLHLAIDGFPYKFRSRLLWSKTEVYAGESPFAKSGRRLFFIYLFTPQKKPPSAILSYSQAVESGIIKSDT